ncbi:ATP-binding protein [Kouleothrix sp.]|uniref:ATP-binding protein n=1 Tax=Kouleothrix sp. TaxID=2779161 RepID=UPI00391A0457
MNNDIVPASLAVQAMRDNGYKNAAYAIAELIDNSIQAGASLVELLCAERRDLVKERVRPRIYQVAVLDNGKGMDTDVLKIALQFGNGTNLTPERQRGMGKFGMGLPSASISQCTKVEVWSWQDGPEKALYTYLDVEQIKKQQQTELPEPAPRQIPSLWREVSDNFGPTGTLVVWSNLDRIFWKTARSIIENSELLVGRMYRRFIANGRTRIVLADFDVDSPVLTFTPRDVLPNDPLYLMPRTSCPEPFDNKPMFEAWGGEHYELTYQIEFRGKKHPVTVRFAVAKNEARPGRNPGSLPHGQHAAKNIGVSIMRADRELELDQSWTIQYDPVERWWGIEVEFPPALDEVFGVTNNKQAARNFAEPVSWISISCSKVGVRYARL